MERGVIWLYFNGEPLTAVLMDPTASDQAVRAKALRDHDANPTIGLERYEIPYHRRQRIARAEVRRR